MNPNFMLVLLAVLVLTAISPLLAVNVDVQLPLERTAYQTNEMIDLAVLRADAKELPASPLSVIVAGEDGSSLSFIFDAAAVAVNGADARATEHLHLNGWLMRPGKYTITVTVHGVTAVKFIEIFSHLRQSTFKLINWGSQGSGDSHIGEGTDGMGFNLIFGEYRPGRNPAANAETTLRGGADFMQVCTMSGAHQMDLRAECDWSDPYVTRGGTARVVQQAFANRTQPNCLGVHFYDEPGLTWENGSPHGVTPQLRAFKSAFGIDAPDYKSVKIDDPAAVAKWLQWGRWKESFMESAWKEARTGVEKVNPTYLSATQSQYGWTAYADGYYFNVVRSLPVISGHGGYDDGVGAYLYPGYHLEFGRMRDLNKPVWYLPTWYNISTDNFRLEQNLSFMTGLQGMATPPWFKAHDPQGKQESQGVVETNKIYAKLGTIFTNMPTTRGQVAMLYSLDQCLDAQIKSGMNDNYEGGSHTRANLLQLYTAGKLLHTSFFPIVEEDVLDGTLAAHHKAVILAGINFLEPKVITALQGYIAAGGTVIVGNDCQVKIPGATALGVPFTHNQYDLALKLWTAGKQKESMYARNAGDFMKETAPVAKAIKVILDKIGVKADMEIDNSRVFANRHVSGDFEYLFSTNATFRENKEGDYIAIKGATAKITLPVDGRPVYDAIHGGLVPDFAKPAKRVVSTTASFTYGPGQMRVFARTARPIAGVEVNKPELFKDYTVANNPVCISFIARIVDAKNATLTGTAPMQVKLIDALGNVRYDLFRASQNGILKVDLPLAVNDPAGKWTIEVKELLANTVGKTDFTYSPPGQCNTALGAAQRAVYFGSDRESIFKFVRANLNVTIVKGTSDYNTAAAARVTEVLKPWGVTCTTVDAADVNKPREITVDEAKTWVGLEFGRAIADTKNTPFKAGFAVNGPVILIGNPADNPLIAKIAEWSFLPYAVNTNFPGRNRGYIAWQYEAVGIGQESISLIANDAAGMSEAIGTMYEAASGIDPMTPYALPPASAVVAAAKKTQLPQLAAVWQVVLPDRPVAVSIDKGTVIVATNDGTFSTIDAKGKLLSQKSDVLPTVKLENPVIPAALKTQLLIGRSVKQVVFSNGITAVSYWGGTIQTFGADNKIKTQSQLSMDAVKIGYAGDTLIAALADGLLIALK